MENYFYFGVLLIFLVSIPLSLYIRSLLKDKSERLRCESLPIYKIEREASNFIDIDEHQIHFKVHGRSKKTLVFLHGIGASTFTWRYLSPLLMDKYQLLIIDLPGFGKSSKRPDYEHDVMSQSILIDQVIKKLEIQNAILVGSSMGGTIAMWMASLFPENYQNIILISPAIQPKLAKLFHLPSIRLFTRPVAGFIINKIFIKKLLQLVCANWNTISEESIDRYYEPYQKNKKAMLCFLNAAEILKDPDLWLNLKNLKANILLIWGKKDIVTPISGRSKIIDRYRGQIQSETCETAGHHVMEDEPEWLAKKIDEYIQNIEL